MGAVVYVLFFKLGALLSPAKLIQMGLLVGSVVIGALVYFGLCIVLKVEELKIILKKL
jgi:putative peptidoglycan lipid II flippase